MAHCISYSNTNYFSKIITDYLAEKEILKEFYSHFPKLENFRLQIKEKQQNYSAETRKILVESLREQYQKHQLSELTEENLNLLQKENTFTITTGHQLNLFTGPLYFLYKIISTINLTQELTEKYPDYNFVPVYWMATEDHDFEEINFFNFKEEKIQWKKETQGAVGKISTESLAEIELLFTKKLNTSYHADFLKDCFKKAYLEHENVTEATRYLANQLFGKFGLVIVDGDDHSLKEIFSPFIKNELLAQTSYKKVSEMTGKLAQHGYKIQVNPREINLFCLKENLRERIIKEENNYFVHETEIRFSEREILEELKNHPEHFSPNVIMRPLYQEVVLPNLCYIGGGGELAYWLQLKSYFEEENISFPILLLRNSALLVSEKQSEKIEKLNVQVEDLFQEQTSLISQKTKDLSAITIDFSSQKTHLQEQFKDLYALAKKTDASFLGAVAAQEKKQINGLAHLEKRLLKAQKRKLKDQLERLTSLQDELFPKQSLQERQVNFAEFYEVYGEELLKNLFENLQPLQQEFTIIKLKEKE